jgi:hypothetical protein
MIPSLTAHTMKLFVKASDDRFEAIRSGQQSRIEAAGAAYEAARSELLATIERAEAEAIAAGIAMLRASATP